MLVGEVSLPLQPPPTAVLAVEADKRWAAICRCPACGDTIVFDALVLTCHCADDPDAAPVPNR